MEQKHFKMFNILWDVDDVEENGFDREEVLASLPVETTTHVTSNEVDFNDESSIADYLGDYLSDRFGFCHNGFEYSEIPYGSEF